MWKMTLTYDMERVNIAALETKLEVDNLCAHDISDEVRVIVSKLRDTCAECAAKLGLFLGGLEDDRCGSRD